MPRSDTQKKKALSDALESLDPLMLEIMTYIGGTLFGRTIEGVGVDWLVLRDEDGLLFKHHPHGLLAYLQVYANKVDTDEYASEEN